MSDVHVCPKCDGTKKVDDHPCPTCGATGVVWRTEEAAEQPPATLDLTYLQESASSR